MKKLEKSEKIASPLRGWLGGKFLLTDKIIEKIPEHTTYAEPFSGAAWVFFHKQKSKIEALNDINSNIVNLYRVVKNHLPELLRQFEYTVPSREEFYDLKNSNTLNLTDIQKASRFIYLHRLAFGGNVANANFASCVTREPKFNNQKIVDELKASSARLSSVCLENLNYDVFIKKYDRAETFFYIDPPYFDCETMYGKDIFSPNDFQKIADLLKNIKGKFLMSINDKEEIREIFKAFKIENVETRYSISKDLNKKVSELFISNY